MVSTSSNSVFNLFFFFLQDILRADIELDGLFKLSFAYDIVNVSHLHNKLLLGLSGDKTQ